MPAVDSRTWLWILLAVAFGLRVATAVGLQAWLDRQPGRTFLIEGDAGGYWRLAEHISAGEDYAIHTPPRRVHRMPGFPALLALPIAMFDQPMLPARLLLAGVGTLACGLVWWLARVLFDTATANIATGLTAVSPVMVGFAPVILSETAFAAAMLASLIGMAYWANQTVGRIANPSGNGVLGGMASRRQPGRHARADDPACSPASRRKIIPPNPGQQLGRIANPSYVRAAILGLVIGALIALACYFRPSWILAGPLFGLGAFITSAHKGRALVLAACVMIGLIGLLLPWALRNQRVSGHFTLTTFWMGPSLYDGLNPDATGESDMTFFDRDNLMGQGISEYDVDRHYRRQAWQFVKQQPGRTIELAFIKLWRFLKPWPNAEQFGGPGPALLIGPFFIAAVVLALRGWYVIRHDFWAWGLTLGPLIYFAALHTIFVSSLRYRLPAEYPLMILAAIGWRSWNGFSDAPAGAGVSSAANGPASAGDVGAGPSASLLTLPPKPDS